MSERAAFSALAFLGRWRLRRSGLLAGASMALALVAALQTPAGTPDLFTEWLVIHGVVDGIDVATPIRELADIYGFDNHLIHGAVPLEAIDPGTPGGLLFDLPLLLVTPGQLRHVSIALSLSAGIGLAFLVARLLDRPWHWVVLFLPLLMLTHPWRDHVALGQWTLVVGALVAWTWLLARKGDEPIYGVPLGMAVAAKLFPWFLVPVLLVTGRVRVALGAVAAFVTLNLVGLTIPGVEVGSLPEWLSGEGAWMIRSPFNGSPVQALGTPVWVPPAAALLTLPFFRGMHLERALAIALPVALLVSPLLWMHYVTILPLAVAGTGGLGLLLVIGLLELNPPLHAFLGTVSVLVFLLARYRMAEWHLTLRTKTGSDPVTIPSASEQVFD